MKQKLDTALIRLWEEVRGYPAWSRRDDFEEHNAVGATDVADTSDRTEKGERSERVGFSCRGRRYEVQYTEHKLFDGDTHAAFSLSENGDEVFAIDASIEYDEVGREYCPFGVSSFKNQGEWARFLLDALKRSEIRRQKASAEFKYFEADKIKARFKE